LLKSLLRIGFKLIVALDDGASYHIAIGIFVLVVGLSLACGLQGKNDEAHLRIFFAVLELHGRLRTFQ
jgi:hypothetical protein